MENSSRSSSKRHQILTNLNESLTAFSSVLKTIGKRNPKCLSAAVSFSTYVVTAGFEDTARASFRKFFDKYRDALTRVVIDSETGGVNDSFLRDNEVIVDVFANADTSLTLNLSTFYRSSVTIHKSSDKPDDKVLPTLLLFYLYNVLNHVVPENDEARKCSTDPSCEDVIWENLNLLCDSAELVAPGKAHVVPAASGPPGNDGPGIEGIMGMVSTLFGSMMGGGDSEKAAEATRAFSGMGSLVKGLVDRVAQDSACDQSDGPVDPTKVINSLGDALKSPEVQKQIASSASSILGNQQQQQTGRSSTTTPSSPLTPPEDTD